MRGVNFGGWLSQIDAIEEKDPEKFPGADVHMETFIGNGDFANVKSWGFDHVRLPIDSYLFFTDDEKPLADRIANLDRAVELSKQNNLKLIIDLHECPGHDFADSTKSPVQKLFADEHYISKAKKIWAFIAERYSMESHVLFESLNEPVAPSAEIWNDVAKKLCAEIRRFASRSTIITGSNMWNWPSAFGELSPIDDDNVIYSVHFYEPLLFTHQNAPWLSEPETKIVRDYPSDYGSGFTRKYGLVMSKGVWNKERFVQELEPVNVFRKKYNVAVICNEFGVYTPVALDAQLRWYNDLLSVLEQMNIGFSYWNYKNLDFGIISTGEKLHEKLPQYDNPERINRSLLEVLRKY
jgi:aryl-phospho-beta-D-glucosidase BglC (GH1 family)